MNAEPVQWSEEKQQRLQECLVGCWAEDTVPMLDFSQDLSLVFVRANLFVHLNPKPTLPENSVSRETFRATGISARKVSLTQNILIGLSSRAFSRH